eukprot:UN14935
MSELKQSIFRKKITRDEERPITSMSLSPEQRKMIRSNEDDDKTGGAIVRRSPESDGKQNVEKIYDGNQIYNGHPEEFEESSNRIENKP